MNELQKENFDDLKIRKLPRPGEAPIIVTAWGKPVALLFPIADALEARSIAYLVEKYDKNNDAS